MSDHHPQDGQTSERWRVKPGERVYLHRIDSGSAEGAPGPGERVATEAELPSLHEELRQLQDRLWAESSRALLVVLQAMDAGGKDGTIKHVFEGVNPQATRVRSFKQPTPLELRHDFLWRVHREVPAAGEIGIFNRSHYEDVLTVRVHGLVPEHKWRERFDLINSFEETLRNGGTKTVKLYLHISKDEQRKRLEERLRQPDKRWKFRPADLEERARWDDYKLAYEDLLSRTSTAHAPWYVIPSDHKWYRNWAVSRILIDTLGALDPQYPKPLDLDGVHVD
jgi:PPK2 family polyphosphate:nucleotide phosphotransferase